MWRDGKPSARDCNAQLPVRRKVRNFPHDRGFPLSHMNHDEHDDLWQLLGKARPPRISPFFSRNVLRAIRAEEPESKTGWFGALWRHWRRVSLAAAAIALVTSFSIQTNRREIAEANTALDEAAHEVASSPDFPVIENLDMLLASDDNDVWLDPSLR